MTADANAGGVALPVDSSSADLANYFADTDDSGGGAVPRRSFADLMGESQQGEGEADPNASGADEALQGQQEAQAGEKPPPWHTDPRWQAWQQERQSFERLRGFESVVNQFAAMGFTDGSQVMQALAQQEIDARMQAREAELSEQVEMGALSSEWAERIMAGERMQAQLEQQQKSLLAQVQAQAINHARAELGNLTPEIEAYLRTQPAEQIPSLVAVMKTWRTQEQQAGMAAYEKRRQRQLSAPTPQGGGGSAPRPAAAPGTRLSFGDLLMPNRGR